MIGIAMTNTLPGVAPAGGIERMTNLSRLPPAGEPPS